MTQLNSILLLYCAMGGFIPAFSQTTPVKIVFDVTTADPAAHASAVRHIKLMSGSYPDSEFELVVYGKALPMLLKNESTVAGDIEELGKKSNVSFVVCEMTMKRHETSKEDLINGVRSVPDGILEIAMKQAEGWGYIKEAHN